MAQAKDISQMAAAEKQVNDLLTQRHKPQGDKLPDFKVRNLTEIMATAEQSAKVMSLLLGSIALVSLLVFLLAAAALFSSLQMPSAVLAVPALESTHEL